MAEMKYTKAYEDLMDSVLVDLGHQDLPALNSSESSTQETATSTSINGFLQAILISILVGFFVFISGVRKRSNIKN